MGSTPDFDHTYWRTALLPALAALLLGAPACGGKSGRAELDAQAPASSGAAAPQSSRSVAPPANTAALPSPASLAAGVPGLSRRSSYVEADLIKNGDDIDNALPFDNMSFLSSTALFIPDQQDPEKISLSRCAYASYSFQAPGYDRGGLVRLTTSAPMTHDAYIGLSDWNNNRWRWFRGRENIQTGDLTPYFNGSGTLLLVVVVPYYGPWVNMITTHLDLELIRLGATPPIASFTATPATGQPPLMVDFDASASAPGEGSITSHEWDFDGDGDYDLNSGADATISHEYVDEGFYDAALRVSTNLGESRVATRQIRALDYWQHSYSSVANLGFEFRDSTADAAGNIYLVGDVYIDGPDQTVPNALVCKLDHFGQPLWARGYSAGDYSQLNAVVIDSAGDIFAGGFYSADSSDCLVQKWDPEGLLLWSRAFGDPDLDDSVNDIAVSGTEVFVAGDFTSNVENKLLLARLDGSGVLSAAASRQPSAGGPSSGQVVLPRRNILTGATTGVTVLGDSYSLPSGENYIFRADFDDDLTEDNSYRILQSGSDILLTAASYNNSLVPGAARFNLAGRVIVGGVRGVFILRTGFTGASEYGLRINAPGFDNDKLKLSGLASYQGNYLLSGVYDPDASGAQEGPPFALLLDGVNPALLGARYLDSSGQAYNASLLPYSGATLMHGSALGAPPFQWQDLTGSTAQSYSRSWVELPSPEHETQFLVGYEAPGNTFDLLGDISMDQPAVGDVRGLLVYSEPFED